MAKFVTYIKESVDDLINKVSWPTWNDLQNSSVVVAVASLFIALIVYLMDTSMDSLISMFYKLF